MVLVSSFSGVCDEVATRRVYGFLLVFFIVSAFWSPVRQGRLLSSGLPEVRFVHDIKASYRAVRDNNQHFAQIMNTGSDWKPVPLPGQHQTYILAIGESARRGSTAFRPPCLHSTFQPGLLPYSP